MSDPICEPCAGGSGPMTEAEADRELAALHPDWRRDGVVIRRRLVFRNFARAMQAANVAGWLGEQAGHHPDIAFGWGYCEIGLTSHEAKGLTRNDFVLAAQLDRLFP